MKLAGDNALRRKRIAQAIRINVGTPAAPSLPGESYAIQFA
jgi:hypothetical protein